MLLMINNTLIPQLFIEDININLFFIFYFGIKKFQAFFFVFILFFLVFLFVLFLIIIIIYK